MAALIRATDWSATPLGPIERWPERLRIAVEVCLDSAQPTFVWWGPQLAQIYNDAALAIMGLKHPEALGRPGRQTWSDIWPTIGPFIEQVASSGKPVRGDDVLMHPDRGQQPQEAWFTVSYSALRQADGQIAGVLIAAVETTARMRADRDFRALFAASPTPFLALAPDAPRFTILEINDAFLQVAMRRREQLIGAALFEAFPDNPNDPFASGASNVQASLERVIASRRPDTMPVQKYDVARPDGVFEERFWSSINTPLIDAAGNLSAIIHHVEDVTERHRAGQALRESEARHAFLLRLADTLKPLDDAIDLQTKACRLLGEQLRVAQVGFGEIDEGQAHTVVHRDWSDGRLPSVVGTWRMADFGEAFVQTVRAGLTYVLSDAAVDTRTSAPEVGAAYASIAVRAALVVPLVKHGRLVALLFVNHLEPRAWSAAEIELVEQTCARLWAEVERARAEAALRASEERYRLLAENLTAGAFGWDLASDTVALPRRAREVFGFDQNEPVHAEVMLGRIHPHDLPAVRAGIEAALDPAGRGECRIDYRVAQSDGSIRWVQSIGQVRFEPLANGERRAVHMDGVIWDVTDYRQLVEALRQASTLR